MTADGYKFLSGSAAGLAYAHAAYAIAASKGIINEPIFLGRRWTVKFMWIEVVIYSALSLGAAYRGWGGLRQLAVPPDAPGVPAEPPSPPSPPAPPAPPVEPVAPPER